MIKKVFDIRRIVEFLGLSFPTILFFSFSAAFYAARFAVSHSPKQTIFAHIPNKEIKDFMLSDWKAYYINEDVHEGVRKIFGILPTPSFLLGGYHLFNTLFVICIVIAVASALTTSIKDDIWNFLTAVIVFALLWHFVYFISYHLLVLNA